MDANNTLFRGNTSIGSQSDGPVPLYLTYLKMFMLSILVPSVTIPAVMVIRIILKNAVLKTRNNIFLVNLLIADVCIALVRWLLNTTLMIPYLLGFNITINCTIYFVPMLGLVMATKLMFVPLSVDRFVHIAFPFSYKKIMTTKVIAITISSLWLLSIFVSTVSVVNQPPTTYIPSLGACRIESTSPLFHFILAGLVFISAVLNTITSIYLRYRIIKSNKFFHSVKRSAAEEQKSIKAGRLVEILQEQIRPTLSVFIAGGVDGVLNMIHVIIYFVVYFNFSNTGTLYITHFLLIPIQLCQSLSHILSYGLYNKEIRKRLLDNYCSRKCCRSTRSKVVTLNRQR